MKRMPRFISGKNISKANKVNGHKSILTNASHRIKHNRNTQSTGGYVDHRANFYNGSIRATLVRMSKICVVMQSWNIHKFLKIYYYYYCLINSW